MIPKQNLWTFCIGMCIAFLHTGPACGQLQPDVFLGGKPKRMWLSLLGHVEPSARLRSCEALGLLGPRADDAVPQLIVLAEKDPSAAVRAAAILAIGEIGPKAESAKSILLLRLLDPGAIGPSARPLEEALAGIGKAAVPDLMKHLEGPSKSTRIRCIETLGLIGPDAGPAVPSLVQQLRSAKDDQAYLQVILDALRRIGRGAKSAAPALNEMLPSELRQASDTNHYTRKRLIKALIGIGDPPVALLLRELAGPARRYAVVEMLGEIGPGARSAVPTLVAMLNDKNSDSEVRVETAIALSRIDPLHPMGVPALIGSIDDDSGAFLALARLGSAASAALPELEARSLMQGTLFQVDALGAAILIDSQGRRIIPTLIRAFQLREPPDGTPFCELSTVEALGRIGTRAREAADPLLARFIKGHGATVDGRSRVPTRAIAVAARADSGESQRRRTAAGFHPAGREKA